MLKVGIVGCGMIGKEQFVMSSRQAQRQLPI